MAKSPYVTRKNMVKVMSSEGEDLQFYGRGRQSAGQDGDQQETTQARLPGQKITPKKHWLKVLPPVEEFNNRVTFRPPVQKQIPPASSEPPWTHLRHPGEPASQKSHLALSKEMTSQKSHLSKEMTPQKSHLSKEMTQQRSHLSKETTQHKPHISPALGTSPVKGRQSPVATQQADQLVPKKHWVKVLPSIEQFNNKQPVGAAVPRHKLAPNATTSQNSASANQWASLQKYLKTGSQLLLPPQPALEGATTAYDQDPGDDDGAPPPEELSQYKIDPFVSSDSVIKLEDASFQQFVLDKDITLVMFYDKECPMSSWSRSQFKQAAEMTNRPNHQYAAVDCSEDSPNRICKTEGITSIPFFKIYSRGQVVAKIREPKTFQANIMKNVVEKTPLRRRPNVLET